MTQVNILEEDTNQSSGFAEFKGAYEEDAEGFDGPVLVHSDPHTIRIVKPIASHAE